MADELPEVTWSQYPQRKCRLPVAGEWSDYPCEVREQHPGPCASPSVRASITARAAWEKDNPQWQELMRHDDPFGQVTP